MAVNTFRVNSDGSISSFSGGIIDCLFWKGIIDPEDPELNLTEEQRVEGRRIIAEDKALQGMDLEQILDCNQPLEKGEE